MIVHIQESISPNSLNKNLIFKHSLDAKINLEVKESKIIKDCGV